MFWYCLPDSFFCYSLYPETSSRVTLAALGIGFQPKLPTTKHQQPIIIYFYLLIFYSQQSDHKFWLEANTERSESNPGRSLGVKTKKGKLSGRQYLANMILDKFLYQHVFRTFFILHLTTASARFFTLHFSLSTKEELQQVATVSAALPADVS